MITLREQKTIAHPLTSFWMPSQCAQGGLSALDQRTLCYSFSFVLGLEYMFAVLFDVEYLLLFRFSGRTGQVDN